MHQSASVMWQTRLGKVVEWVMSATARFQDSPEEHQIMTRSIWTGVALHRYGSSTPIIITGYLLELFLERRIQEHAVREHFGEDVAYLLGLCRHADASQTQMPDVCVVRVAYAIVCLGNMRQYSESVCAEAEAWLMNARDNDDCRDGAIVTRLEKKLEQARNLQPV